MSFLTFDGQPLCGITGDDYGQVLADLLPRGEVWPRDLDTVQQLVMRGLAEEFARVTARDCDLLDESYPCGAIEALPDWERVLGLPDPCVQPPLSTLQQRQIAVCAKLAAVGGQSEDYFIDLAASLGYIITIETFSPFRVEMNSADDPLYGQEWVYAWRVNVYSPLIVTWFRVDLSRAEEPLAVYGDDTLRCMLIALKPAHTTLLFDYHDPVSISFMTPGTLDPLIAFTRASIATYIDSGGVMRSVGTNQPRWDYDPATHALRGLLIEDARTNDIPNSNTANPGFLSAASTDVPALLAGATVWKVTTTATAGDVYGAFTGLACAVGQSITASVWVWIPASYSAAAGAPRLDMDIGGVGTGGSETIGAADLSKRGQWQRVVSSMTLGAGASTSYNFVWRQNAPHGAGNVFYFTCSQSEQNADFATSYIQTGAGPGTRAQDKAGIPPTNMDWLLPPGGSWFAEFISLDPTPGTLRIVGRPTGGETPLYVHPDGPRLGQYDGSFNLSANFTLTPNAVHKGASTFANGVGRICLDGGAVTSGPMLSGYAVLSTTGIAFLTIAGPGGAENMSGYIRAFRYQAPIMTDAEMQAITI